MDGQVKAIRKALDDEGFKDVAIMSHSAKHRSNFYSPFRDAAECAPKFSDRRTYQVPFTNPREAMREVETDIEDNTLGGLPILSRTKRIKPNNNKDRPSLNLLTTPTLVFLK